MITNYIIKNNYLNDKLKCGDLKTYNNNKVN